jgi:hypothetical protein
MVGRGSVCNNRPATSRRRPPGINRLIGEFAKSGRAPPSALLRPSRLRPRPPRLSALPPRPSSRGPRGVPRPGPGSLRPASLSAFLPSRAPALACPLSAALPFSLSPTKLLGVEEAKELADHTVGVVEAPSCIKVLDEHYAVAPEDLISRVVRGCTRRRVKGLTVHFPKRNRFQGRRVGRTLVIG